MQTSPLDWINLQQQAMAALLQAWTLINSGSDNLVGLSQMISALEARFSSLGGEMLRIDLPPRTTISASGEFISQPHGQALHITKRREAPVQVFFGGHMDTVYGPVDSFQSVTQIDDNMLRGPGVADMKGGLIVMLTALEALEKHPLAKNIGWEVLINPDEEVGSVGSEALFESAARRNQLGLVFEPAFADGAIVSSRKGSANLTAIAKGRAAHAGRDFDKGRNAVAALAEFIVTANRLNHKEKGISVNFGQISGGGPVNIVSDFAVCRLNVRAIDMTDFENVQNELQGIAANSEGDGLTLTLHLQQARGPKPFDEKCRRLFDQLNACAQEEGFALTHRPSGGVCDGNILAAAGLPVIDTLGVVGGDIHTSNEYMRLDSLVERSRLVSLFLIKLAEGALPPI